MKNIIPQEPIDLDKVAILLDIDGTILEFAPTPREVWVPPTLRQTLQGLFERTGGALALVSGRSLNDLDLLVAPLQLPAIGGHGAELSKVAFAITGARWNGPRFFGLRDRAAAEVRS